MRGFSRHVERRFKPVHWVIADGIPLGYSATDLDRLARRGVEWLRRAAVERGDVIVSLLPPGPSVAHWQLVLGCRRAGVSAIHLGPGADPAMLDRLVPSVLVGEPGLLHDVLGVVRRDQVGLSWLRAVLAVGDPLSVERRGRLRELAGGVPVVGAWAPPGVRAIWTECRAGAEQELPAGYHPWEDDVLEVASGAGAVPGELLWTGVGWSGSALLRLRTFAVASVTREPCPACGRPGGLVVPHAPVSRPSPGAPSSDVPAWSARAAPTGPPITLPSPGPSAGDATLEPSGPSGVVATRMCR